MPRNKPIGVPFKFFFAFEAKIRVDLHSTIPLWGKVQVQILPDPVCKPRPARLPFCPGNAEQGSTTNTCTHSFKLNYKPALQWPWESGNCTQDRICIVGVKKWCTSMCPYLMDFMIFDHGPSIPSDQHICVDRVDITCPRFCGLNREELRLLQVQSRNQRIFILVLGMAYLCLKAFRLEPLRKTDSWGAELSIPYHCHNQFISYILHTVTDSNCLRNCSKE